MTDLSPAAQVIHDAYWNEPDDGYENTALAACLRAAANQVDWSWEHCSQLFAIADELDGYPDDKLTCEELEEMEQGISAYYDSLALQHPGKCVFHKDEPSL